MQMLFKQRPDWWLKGVLGAITAAGGPAKDHNRAFYQREHLHKEDESRL